MKSNLESGVNVDILNIPAGMAELSAIGYEDARTRMVVEYALVRWARGEEEDAERGAIDQTFHGIDFTCWRRVLAAAMAGANNECNLNEFEVAWTNFSYVDMKQCADFFWEAGVASQQAAHDAELAKLKEDLEVMTQYQKNSAIYCNELTELLSTANERIAYLEGLVALQADALKVARDYVPENPIAPANIANAKLIDAAISATAETVAKYKAELTEQAEARGAVKAREDAAQLCESKKALIFEFSDEIVKETAINVIDNLAKAIRATSKKG